MQSPIKNSLFMYVLLDSIWMGYGREDAAKGNIIKCMEWSSKYLRNVFDKLTHNIVNKLSHDY